MESNALSKRVLFTYPKFPQASLSHSEVIKIIGKKAFCPPLGLITAAAMLPDQWEMRLVDINIRNVTEQEWDWAEIVMIGGMVVQVDGMLDLIRESKKRGKLVVVGGPIATSYPDKFIEADCDFLVRGEAENTIPLLLAAMENGEAKGVIENSEKPDLTRSPIPRFDLLDLDAYTSLSIQTSRGCPFDCEFCDIVSLFGHKPRYKKPEQVLNELDALFKLTKGPHHIFLVDDNFIGNKKTVKNLLEKMITWSKANGEPFGFNAQTSINLGQDLELIDLMTEANFNEVCIGIESPDEEALRGAHKYHNLKHSNLESLITINKNGLTPMGSFIIGFDGEKKGVGERICAFVEEANIPLTVIHTLQAPPNTKLWNRLEEEGRLRVDRFQTEGFEMRLNFVPSRPESEIIGEYIRAWDYLYEPSRSLARVYRSVIEMRPTRKAMAIKKGEPVPKPIAPRAQHSAQQKREGLIGFLKIIWRQGIKARTRGQFWKQLYLVRRKNPSRLKKYIVNCALMEDYHNYRKFLLEWGKINGYQDGEMNSGYSE